MVGVAQIGRGLGRDEEEAALTGSRAKVERVRGGSGCRRMEAAVVELEDWGRGKR